MAGEANLPLLYTENEDDFIVIAHRGASAYYPENTMVAFQGAQAMDAEMIELDVMMSKDGEPVVFHDVKLDHHTNGKGRLVNKTLKELKKLDAGSWFDKEFSGEKIPTLREVLEFSSGRIALNIEIKSEAVSDELRRGIEEKSLELVKEYGMENHVIFSSFDYRAIKHLKELDTEIPVAVLYNNRNKNESKRELPHKLVGRLGVDAFNCSFRQFSKRWSRDLQEHNIPHFIYTVDRPKRMERLLKDGVSGIFTNKPDVLRRVAQKAANK